jgi:hypothetical protein
LKEYLVKGYAISDKIKSQQYDDLKQTVKLLANVIGNKELSAKDCSFPVSLVYGKERDIISFRWYKTNWE